MSYYVHEVPAGFDVNDGQDKAEIEATEEHPCVGAFIATKGEEGFGDDD